MEKARIDGVEIEYEVIGTGEPVLLVAFGPIASGFLPLMSGTVLERDYRLIRYHRRGMQGRANSQQPATFTDHAADAAALLGYLGVPSAHVAGHSTGATIALQIALDYPTLVHTLALLEPPLMAAPSAADFIEKAGPSLEKYATGDHAAAMTSFLSLASGLEWEICRSSIDERVPGGVARAINDADNFFGGELPALIGWKFGPQEATNIPQPILSVLGTQTDPWFLEAHNLLHSWFSRVEDCEIEGVGHLLQMQRPRRVAKCLAEFFHRHPLAVDEARTQVLASM